MSDDISEDARLQLQATRALLGREACLWDLMTLAFVEAAHMPDAPVAWVSSMAACNNTVPARNLRCDAQIVHCFWLAGSIMAVRAHLCRWHALPVWCPPADSKAQLAPHSICS